MSRFASRDASVSPAGSSFGRRVRAMTSCILVRVHVRLLRTFPYESLRVGQRVSWRIPPSTDCAGRTGEPPLHYDSASVAAAWQRRVESARRQHRAPAVRWNRQSAAVPTLSCVVVVRGIGQTILLMHDPTPIRAPHVPPPPDLRGIVTPSRHAAGGQPTSPIWFLHIRPT
jgi:hypothetical protein